MSAPEPDPGQPRRAFVKEAAALAIGGAATLVPVVAGLTVWLDPLRRAGSGAEAGFLPVTSLEALPADGVPRKFTVVADQRDAWTKTPNVPVGAIYLARTADGEITALQSICPHAGCFVEFRPGQHQFFCPCHNSSFAPDGSINDPRSPSPRSMDRLPVELRDDQVWVKFQRFQAGHRDQRPTT